MLHKENILPRDKAHGCYCGGIVNWRVRAVHWVAKIVGLHVKIEGMPLGTARNLETSTHTGSGSLSKFCDAAVRDHVRERSFDVGGYEVGSEVDLSALSSRLFGNISAR